MRKTIQNKVKKPRTKKIHPSQTRLDYITLLTENGPELLWDWSKKATKKTTIKDGVKNYLKTKQGKPWPELCPERYKGCETKELPLDKLYGHKIDNVLGLLGRAEHKDELNPIDVIRIGDKYLVDDGMGRSTRAAWMEKGKVKARIVREYDDECQLCGHDRFYWDKYVKKFDPNEVLELLVDYFITQDTKTLKEVLEQTNNTD